MKYAQGEVSFEFKALVKEAVKSADSDEKLDTFLNVLHDAFLTAKNDPDGLRAAVKLPVKLKTGVNSMKAVYEPFNALLFLYMALFALCFNPAVRTAF